MEDKAIKPEPMKVDPEQALINADLVFAKNCTNTHGVFAIGDPARRAFSKDLVDSYTGCGILVPRE